MHRSGTYMLGQIVNRMGIYMGEKQDMFTGDIYNEEGYYEYKEIVNIHESILKKCNMRWFEVYDELDNEYNMFCHDGKKKIITLLKSIYITNDSFCIKDPRLCLFLYMWKEIINELNLEVYCIGIFRNPIAVCNSLSD